MKHGNRVCFRLPREPKQSAFGKGEQPEHIPGIWFVIDKAPDLGWWLQPLDDAAKNWAAENETTNGCIRAKAHQLDPAYRQSLYPK